MITIYVRSGQTDYIDFSLTSGGTAIDLSSYDHVVLVLQNNQGSVTSYSSAAGSPIVFVTDPTNGVVELRPTASIFVAAKAPYQAYFQIFPSASRMNTIPSNDEYFLIKVQESYI